MIKVFDADGKKRTLEWALEKYNPILKIVAKSRDHWELVALHENCRDSSMTVRLVGKDVDDIPVAFSWPDAPYKSLPKEPKPRHVAQLTNENGDVGFGMGGGAYYQPPNVGPHAVWVAMYPDHVSDCVDGLGMLGKRDHWHLEPTFQFVKGEIEPPPVDCDDYLSALEEIRDIIDGVFLDS